MRGNRLRGRGVVLSDGRKGLWEDQAIPLHSGEGNRMLREWELEMQFLSPMLHGAGSHRGNLEGTTCKTRFMTSTMPYLVLSPYGFG